MATATPSRQNHTAAGARSAAARSAGSPASAFRRRGRTVLAWLAALLSPSRWPRPSAATFKADYSAPGSDSGQAQQLLEERFPAAVRRHRRRGRPRRRAVPSDPTVRADVQGAARPGSREVPHVAAVDDPYAAPGSISPGRHDHR